MKKKYLDLALVCNEMCKIDKLFPPDGLWIDYYNLKDLKDIIIFATKKKKISGII